jgi:hypothetical protein
MMNLKVVKNSIESVILDNDALRVPRTPREMCEDIYWIVAVASWEHKEVEQLTVEDLTDDESRLVSEWYFYHRGQYGTLAKINFIRDMREMFPGLALRTAYNFVTIKER